MAQAIKSKLASLTAENAGLLKWLKIWVAFNCVVGLIGGLILGGLCAIALHAKIAARLGQPISMVTEVAAVLIFALVLGLAMVAASLEIALPVSAGFVVLKNLVAATRKKP